MTWAVIALGSNIAPERHLPQGVAELAAHGRVARVSQVYRTPPVGAPGTPVFLNAAVLWRPHLPPDTLRAWLRTVEARLGRVRTADPNAPRTLDLDLVLWRATPHHPVHVPGQADLTRYAHVALPAAEVAPHWPVAGKPLLDWAADLAPAARAFSPCPRVWAALWRAAQILSPE